MTHTRGMSSSKAREPTYVDLGSIERGRRVSWAWHREFRRHFIGPLLAHRFGSTVSETAFNETHRTQGVKAIWDSPRLLPWLPPAYAGLAGS